MCGDIECPKCQHVFEVVSDDGKRSCCCPNCNAYITYDEDCDVTDFIE